VGAHERGVQSHIILVVGAIGATSRCIVTVKDTLFSGERQVADKILSDSDRLQGKETRQKHSSQWVLSIHEMRLNKLKMQRGPLGPGRTIGTVTVSRGNSLEGFICHGPHGQRGNFQQRNSRDQR
jgi:hypothetical protein